jgi:hypothetical protein
VSRFYHEHEREKIHATAKMYEYNVGAGLAIYAARKAITDALQRASDANDLRRSMVGYDSECDPGHIQDVKSGLWRHLSEAGAVGTAIASEAIAYAEAICEGLKQNERDALLILSKK